MFLFFFILNHNSDGSDTPMKHWWLHRGNLQRKYNDQPLGAFQNCSVSVKLLWTLP